jgi:hypothetical protein
MKLEYSVLHLGPVLKFEACVTAGETCRTIVVTWLANPIDLEVPKNWPDMVAAEVAEQEYRSSRGMLDL